MVATVSSAMTLGWASANSAMVLSLTAQLMVPLADHGLEVLEGLWQLGHVVIGSGASLFQFEQTFWNFCSKLGFTASAGTCISCGDRFENPVPQLASLRSGGGTVRPVESEPKKGGRVLKIKHLVAAAALSGAMSISA